MIISNRKTRFRIKIFILNIFFFIYNFLPNRRLKKFFYFTKSDKFKNYSDLYDVVQELTNKKKVKKVLEIGIGGHNLDYQGGASLLAMSFFFRKAKVYGLDLMNKEFLNSKKIKTFIGSQNDKKFLNNFGKKFGPLDIIIDDGSHFVKHQLTSFNNLYKYLNENGIYVIEDLSGSYKNSSGGDPNLSAQKNIISFFAKTVHSTNSDMLIKKVLRNQKFVNFSKVFFFGKAILIQKKIKKIKAYDNKLAFQKLSTLNKNRKKILLHGKKIKPFKRSDGLIRFR